MMSFFQKCSCFVFPGILHFSIFRPLMSFDPQGHRSERLSKLSPTPLSTHLTENFFESGFTANYCTSDLWPWKSGSSATYWCFLSTVGNLWDNNNSSQFVTAFEVHYFDEMKCSGLFPVNRFLMTVQWDGCLALQHGDTHHYLIIVGRRRAAVIKVVPLPVVFVLRVSSVWAGPRKEYNIKHSTRLLDRFSSS